MSMLSLALILAQAEAPPADFSGWLANAAYGVGLLGAVLWCWTLIRDLRSKKEETPQPFVVAPHVVYATKPEHDSLEEDLKTLIANSDARFAALSRASSESREKIFNLIREQNDKMRADMATQMAGVSVQMEGVNSRLFDVLKATSELKGEVKRLPSS